MCENGNASEMAPTRVHISEEITGLDAEILSVLKVETVVTVRGVYLALDRRFSIDEINRRLGDLGMEGKVIPVPQVLGGGEGGSAWLKSGSHRSANTVVLVDLGNVHDCLEQCEKERARGNISAVYGFANKHFNAYGVNPPPRDPETKVAVVEDGVELAIVWKACELSRAATDAGNSLKLVIATKSHKLEPLTALVKSAGHEVRFVRTAAGL